MKTILLDIDNTLFETARFAMTPNSQSLWDQLSRLRDDSHGNLQLIGFTSRPWILKLVTQFQLRSLGIKFDQLLMGKPRGDVYVDNRAVNFDCRWSNADKTLEQIKIILYR